VSPVILRQEHHPLSERMCVEGMGPCLAVEGATTKAIFEAYVESRCQRPRSRRGGLS
jgi:hypothetical protein